MIVALTLVFLMGLTSLLVGKQYLEKHERAVAKVSQHQQEHIQRNVQYFSDEMGLLLYYLRFALINKADPLTALSIGQRDINPTIQSVTIRGLEAQCYDTDLQNPANLLSGNLDLGFVIIYLFPLLIIAFTFNLYSSEKENGTWSLVSIQSKSSAMYLLSQLLIRVALVFFTLTLLFVLAFVILPLKVDGRFLAFVAISFLYLVCWFALSFWIISYRKSSSFNVLLLLSLWVLFSILLPASVNSYMSNKYPVPEALGTMIKQRDAFHEKWDVDKEKTMSKFYAHYPGFKKYGFPDESFSWLWYYAMQQMGDDESVEMSKEMSKQIFTRENSSLGFAMFIPTMYTQLVFNDLAGSSLGDHLQFLDETKVFHEKKRLYFYPKIFQNANAKTEQWEKFKPEYFDQLNKVNWAEAFIPLIATIVLFSALCVFNFYRYWK